MAHWRSMTDRETLGAWDLVGKDGQARDFTLQIVRVEARTVQSKEKPKGERRPHIWFQGASKALVCNATNAETISKIAGSEDTDRWVGQKVTLYATTTRAARGGQVPCIRIRPMRASGPVEEMGDGQPVDPEMRAAQNEGSGEA